MGVAEEGGDDLRGQGFQAFVPTKFSSIDRTVAAYDPAHVAGAWRSQHVRRRYCRLFPIVRRSQRYLAAPWPKKTR